MPAALASPPAPVPSVSAPVRVLIADDSAVVRGLVARWLAEAGFEVVATASNGRIALDGLTRHDPDVVLLDIDMPELDGTQALPLLLARAPGLQVVMMSTLTQRNADISLKCLALGAVDYLAKPGGSRGGNVSDEFRANLIERVRLFGARRTQRPPTTRPVSSAVTVPPRPSPPMVLRQRPRGNHQPRCLLIGASTGGPRAVHEVLERIGAAALHGVPVLVVQHMPPVFTAVFAEHLGARIGLPTAEARADEPVLPGRIYVAPGGRHMGLLMSRSQSEPTIRLDDGPAVNFCRPAVDVLFRDAAACFGAATVSVVLTGMGSDGTAGSRALGDTGGLVLVQDEASSTVWGMPGSVAKAGLAHGILPLAEIGPAVKAQLTGAIR